VNQQAKRKARGLTMRGVGGPGWKLLNIFGSFVWDAFGTLPYLVGSASRSKEWHDVDVRLLLDDDAYEAWFGKPRNPDDKRAAMELAFSVFGERLTGLPIDFQIQQQTYANEHYREERHALGIEEKRYAAAPAPQADALAALGAEEAT
jgi:hypothetical protein